MQTLRHTHKHTHGKIEHTHLHNHLSSRGGGGCMKLVAGVKHKHNHREGIA